MIKKLLLTALLTLGTVWPAYADRAQYMPDVVLTAPGAIWTDVRNYPTTGSGRLYNAIAALNANSGGGTLLVSQSLGLGNNITVDPDVTLKFTEGSVITTNSYNLVITGVLDADRYQIFNGSGVSFAGTSSTFEIYPEWWGADANDSGADTTALNYAITAAMTVGVSAFTQGGTVSLGTGAYNISGALTTITGGITICGQGPFATYIIQGSPSSNTINVNASGGAVMIRDLGISYTAAGPGTSSATAIFFDGGGSYSKITRVYIVDAWNGIHMHSAAYWTITDSIIYGNEKYSIWVENDDAGDAGDSTISNNLIIANGLINQSVGIKYSSSGGLKIIGNKILYAYRCIEIIAVNEGAGGLNSWYIIGNNLDVMAAGADYSIYISDNGSGVAINTGVIADNNEVSGGIYLNGSSADYMYFITITGNNLTPGAAYNNAVAGIYVNKAKWVNITGNIVRKFTSGYPSYGIYATTGSDAYVNDNYTMGFSAGETVAGDGVWGTRHTNAGVLQEKILGGSWGVSYVSSITISDDITVTGSTSTGNDFDFGNVAQTTYMDLVGNGTSAFRMFNGATHLVSFLTSGGNTYIDSVGNLYFRDISDTSHMATITSGGQLLIEGDSITIITTQSPAAGSACTAGEISWDTGFLYVCTATNTWKRVALTGGY